MVLLGGHIDAWLRRLSPRRVVRVSSDTDDLSHLRLLRQLDSFTYRVLVWPVVLRKFLIDDDDWQRRGAVDPGKRAPLLNGYPGGLEVAEVHGVENRGRAVR